MPPRRSTDPERLHLLLREHERVVTHAQLTAIDVAPSTIVKRMRPGGPWQFAHPGVLIAHRGTPTLRERILAAMAYAGPGAVLTGGHALSAAGLKPVSTGPVRVLIPAGRHRTSRPDVFIERTRRLPVARPRLGVQVAPPARALFDAVRQVPDLDDVRDLVSRTVQQGLVTIEDFAAEVFSGPKQRSALGRRVFGEVRAGIRSVAEARARDLIGKAGLDEPLWNVTLIGSAGETIATPDAFWPVGVVLEIDSRQWHLSAASYERTQKRQRRMGAFDVVVLPVAPAVVMGGSRDWLDELRAALREAAETRRHKPLRVHPLQRVPSQRSPNTTVSHGALESPTV